VSSNIKLMLDEFFSDKKNLAIALLIVACAALVGLFYFDQPLATGPQYSAEELARREATKKDLLKSFPNEFVLDNSAVLEYENAESTRDGLKLTKAFTTMVEPTELAKRYRANFTSGDWQETSSITQGNLQAIVFLNGKERSRLNVSISRSGETSKFVLSYYPRLASLDDPLR